MLALAVGWEPRFLSTGAAPEATRAPSHDGSCVARESGPERQEVEAATPPGSEHWQLFSQPWSLPRCQRRGCRAL